MASNRVSTLKELLDDFPFDELYKKGELEIYLIKKVLNFALKGRRINAENKDELALTIERIFAAYNQLGALREYDLVWHGWNLSVDAYCSTLTMTIAFFTSYIGENKEYMLDHIE